MGPVQGDRRVHPHLSPSPTHGWESEEEGRRCRLTGELEKWAFLGKHRAGHLHQKTKYQRRQYRCASKEEGKCPDNIVIISTFNALIGRINGGMTPEQYPHSLQHILLPLAKSWWDKHPNEGQLLYKWRARCNSVVYIKKGNPSKMGDEKLKRNIYTV